MPITDHEPPARRFEAKNPADSSRIRVDAKTPADSGRSGVSRSRGTRFRELGSDDLAGAHEALGLRKCLLCPSNVHGEESNLCKTCSLIVTATNNALRKSPEKAETIAKTFSYAVRTAAAAARSRPKNTGRKSHAARASHPWRFATKP